MGLRAKVDGHDVHLGRRAWAQPKSHDACAALAPPDRIGVSEIWLSTDATCGRLLLRDDVRPEEEHEEQRRRRCAAGPERDVAEHVQEAELRREVGKSWISELLASDNILGDDTPGDANNTNNSRKVWAVYSELLAPITKQLELQFAIRHDHYQTVGLHCHEPVDADTKGRHAVRLLHDDVHGDKRRRFSHGIDTSRRHGGRW